MMHHHQPPPPSIPNHQTSLSALLSLSLSVSLRKERGRGRERKKKRRKLIFSLSTKDIQKYASIFACSDIIHDQFSLLLYLEDFTSESDTCLCRSSSLNKHTLFSLSSFPLFSLSLLFSLSQSKRPDLTCVVVLYGRCSSCHREH